MSISDRKRTSSTLTAKSSVRRRVVAGLAAIVVAFSALTAYSVILHRRTVAKTDLINRSYLPLTLGTSEIRATQLVFNTMMDRLADDINQSVTRGWINAARRYRPSTLHRLTEITDEALASDISKDEAEFLEEIKNRLVEVERRYSENESRFEELYSLMDTGRIDEARLQIEGLKRVERMMDRVLAGIGDEVSLHVTFLAEEAEADEARATWALGILTLAAALMAIGVIVSTNRLLVPLKTLQNAVARVAKGDLSARTDLGRNDEIGALGAGFNKMTEALVDRDRMLIRSERLSTAGKMAAQVTHEIRNPLSSLRLNAELLEEELSENSESDESRALLKAMQDEIERLTGITESYLSFARLPQPKAEFDDLNAVVEAAVDFMRGEITEHRIDVDLRLAANLEQMPFDRGQIRQALVNLLRNACEAMPEGGSLSVETRKNGSAVELVVEDTGDGVPTDAMDQIFESFYSLKSGGTGLGLPLVRQICLAHGGDVRCDKTGKSGSTFVISLPARDEKGERLS